jgi:hypothetical protein
MEEETPPKTNYNTQLIHSHNQDFYHPINSIYKQISSFLNYFNPADHENVIALSAIITRTKELKASNIMEQDIGLFASQQKPSFSFMPAKNHPYYTRIFVERLAEYNAKLEKDKIISPTPEQFADHKENQKTQTILQRFRTINISIDQQIEKGLLISIPWNIAISDFEQLMHDTNIILSIPLQEAKDMVGLLYILNIRKQKEDIS